MASVTSMSTPKDTAGLQDYLPPPHPLLSLSEDSRPVEVSVSAVKKVVESMDKCEHRDVLLAESNIQNINDLFLKGYLGLGTVIYELNWLEWDLKTCHLIEIVLLQESFLPLLLPQCVD